MGNIYFYEVLEMIMVICFGISWPISIIKSIKTHSTKGKSLLFLFFIWIGYVAGILSKIIANHITYVFIFYCLNLLMVSIDIILFFINKNKYEKCN